MDAGSAPQRHVLSKRTRTLVRIAVTAVALAVVSFVAATLFAPRASAPLATSPPSAALNAPGEQDYRAGLAAIGSGDTTTALDLLTKAAAAGNAKARQALETIKRAPPAPRTPPPSPGDPLTSRVADITSLLPTSVPGFSVGRIEIDPLGASLTLGPRGGNSTKVSLALATVFDRGTESEAKAFVSGIGKAYPDDLRSVGIGDRTGRFGTDGSRLASAAFSKGRYAFEVVVTASGGTPATLMGAALDIAGSFPAAQKP